MSVFRLSEKTTNSASSLLYFGACIKPIKNFGLLAKILGSVECAVLIALLQVVRSRCLEFYYDVRLLRTLSLRIIYVI